MKLQAVLPPFAAFFSGAAVMSLELLGSRIVAPYLGSSVLIWTNLIGVILLAMALGAWCGGVVADRFPQVRIVAWCLGIAGFWCFALSVFAAPILRLLMSFSFSLSAALASLLLLAPPAALLAAVSPMVLRMGAKDVDSLGHVAGLLSAAGTIGSLVGTYATGYVLLPRFPVHRLLLGLGFCLLVVGLVLVRPWKKRWTAFASSFLLVPGFLLWPSHPMIHVYPSAYANVFTWEGTYEGVPSMLLQINTGFHSIGKREDPSVSVLGYVRGLEAADAFVPSPKRILVLGGGGFHVVSRLQRRYPEAEIDVVEIDPAVVQAAERDMGFVPGPKTRIFLEDARTALSSRRPGYDLVVGDVFAGDISMPWYLMTVEAMQSVSRLLSPQGVYAANLIFSPEPTAPVALAFKRNTMATLGASFGWVRYIDTGNNPQPSLPVNVLAFAGNGPPLASADVLRETAQRIATSTRPVANIPPESGGMLWTDDFGNADFQSMEMYRQAWGK